MAIGRSFEESLQKALRMTHPSVPGFTDVLPAGKSYPPDYNLDEALRTPSNTRIHAICKALLSGYSVDKIHDMTAIDKWFLHKLNYIVQHQSHMQSFTGYVLLSSLKSLSFSPRPLHKPFSFSSSVTAVSLLPISIRIALFIAHPC